MDLLQNTARIVSHTGCFSYVAAATVLMQREGTEIMRKLMSLILATVLAASLCSCGGGSSSTGPEKPAEVTTEESKQEAEAAPAEAADANADAADPAQPEVSGEAQKAEEAVPGQPTQAEEIADKYTVSDLPVEGEYTVFAVRNEGYTVSSADMEIESTMSLFAEGTGSLTLMGDTIDITSWSSEDGAFNLSLADGTVTGGNARGGIIELDIYGTGDMLLIYAQEKADTSSYTLLTIDEVKEQMAAAEEANKTKLDNILDGIDPVAGAHLRYQRRLDALNTVQDYDVYAKDGVYYSARTTKVAGAESTLVTFIKDGKVYNLYPDKKTGNYVTDLPLSVTNDNILLMDDLFSEMRMASVRTDQVEEDREIEGASFPAEVYPQTEYSPETVFYFAEDGSLAYCYTAAPVIESAAYVGDSLYTVGSIDGEVDESLFDISAYTIQE